MTRIELIDWLAQPGEVLVERYRDEPGDCVTCGERPHPVASLAVLGAKRLTEIHQQIISLLGLKDWTDDHRIMLEDFNTIILSIPHPRNVRMDVTPALYQPHKRVMQEVFMHFYMKVVDELPPEIGNAIPR